MDRSWAFESMPSSAAPAAQRVPQVSIPPAMRLRYARTMTIDRGATDIAVRDATGRWLGRPRLIAVVCVVALAAIGWLYLGLMVAGLARSGAAGSLGPGMEIFGRFQPTGLARALIEAVCRPMLASGASAGSPVLDFGLGLIMWCAMALAMMLPTAGPMVLTYAEIAETAASKGERVVSPVVLAVGYTSVWIGFAVMAALLQWALTRAAVLDPTLRPASGLFSGAVFLLAGTYQFSALKHACVTLCQRPFPFFFANWTVRTATVFRLGLRQGVYCLGCCWAMMLVMFAVGVMNVVWMAAIGVVMTAEKIATTTRVSHVVGILLIAVGVVFVGTSIAAHWPVPAG
jgi:predicted metal-binding membrane protein